MATSLLIGGVEDRDSAKRRRKEEYKQDLQLQMREREAAKQREKLQDMSVDASGWLDPEKGPERLKPLGGVHWTEHRGRRDERVRPYHTLFLYDRMPGSTYPPPAATAVEAPVAAPYGPYPRQDFVPVVRGGGSIVQPISMPSVDSRPIIVTGGGGGAVPYMPPRYVPIEVPKDDGTARELRSLLTVVQAEKDRLRRDNDDFQRRLQRDLEDERRRNNDQEADARRRMENLRREAEERRREAERNRLEAERLRREAMARPKSVTIRPASKTLLYYDMDDYRLRLIEERKKMEELLKAGKPVQKELWDLRVVPRRPRFRLNLPPTPQTADRANKHNVRDFNDLKFRDFDARHQFRQVYPEIPITNRQLEEQQEALLRRQELNGDKGYHTDRPRHHFREAEVSPRRAISRPGWMDREPTPFPHVQKNRNIRMYGQTDLPEWDSLEHVYESSTEREKQLQSSKKEDLLLRAHRPPSADTLTDDTWLRPSLEVNV